MAEAVETKHGRSLLKKSAILASDRFFGVVEMNKQKTRVRWVRVGVGIASGVLFIMIITTLYAMTFGSELPDIWCVRFYPDGSEKVLYGDDCQIPQDNNTLGNLNHHPNLKQMRTP